MPEHIPFFRVFLSSPGDVNDERKAVLEVLERLPNRPAFREKVGFRVVAWDKPGADTPMLATMSPQAAIDAGLPRPSECDIVICILWSRMGTPFAMEGVEYLSGTYYELLDALNGTRPETIIYRRTEEKLFKSDDKDGQQQYERVKSFFSGELFYDPAIKQIRRGVNSYSSPADFREKFETHLEELVVRLLKRYETSSTKAEPALPVSITTIASKKWDGSPFPGLRSFTKADAPIFFGRERETDELLKRVAENRFVVTVGASGSGKSSLVGAGLLPRLEANAISSETTGSKDWFVVQFTPGQGDHPFAALFDGIIKTFEVLRPTPFEQRRVKNQFVQDVLADPMTVCDTLTGALETVKAPVWAEVLLFIDQFEELFTLAKPESIAPFAAILSRLAVQPRVRVIVTMRHDFVHRAIEIPELAALLNMASFNLAAPMTGALAQMIKRPAELAALEFEDGLPEQILSDMGSAAGALALMAYTLDELYKIADSRHDRRLTLADYQGLGGVQGAIGKRAEQTFQRLSLNDKETLLRRVFRELVEVDERGTATRQRASQGRFGEQELALVRAFTDARLLVMDENEVEVAHEALFRSWERLKDWIVEAQEDLILLRQMRNAAHDWQTKGRPDYLLWPQERLKLVYAMQERLNPELNEFEQAFTEPEQARLLREIANIETDHKRRRWIGERLATIGDPRTNIGLDKQGVPQIDWLLVSPGGEIEIESWKFWVQPFYVAKYLITYPQFQAFVEASDGFKNERWWQGFPDWYIKHKISSAVAQYENYPRDSMSWYQAVAFGRWLDAKCHEHNLFAELLDGNWEIRLPTEQEWQWMSQNGVEKREYAWGKWDERPRANTAEAGLGNHSTAVGMYPEGRAECGALDVAGNLWEWCLNDYVNPEVIDGYGNGEGKVMRGGSFGYYQELAAASYRSSSPPNFNNDFFGFRLVLSASHRVSGFWHSDLWKRVKRAL